MLRSAYSLLGVVAFFPLQMLSYFLSWLYLGFLALNVVLVLFVPILFDFYVASEPRLMGQFRNTAFYEDTSFWGAPLLFAIVVFFNLLIGNSLLNTKIYRNSWHLYRPVHYAPVSVGQYAVVLTGLGYYALCFAVDWSLYSPHAEVLFDKVALLSAEVEGWITARIS
ncbi:hypothetical protein [Polycladidibacter stylochi]|uniref:hypothetical protein n=1 Tax=Polycladidibacter stylochi TaxID=1807766 RepID=UPI000AA23F89|nr:hypothetical protein [Pseudovibrio stylochi]